MFDQTIKPKVRRCVGWKHRAKKRRKLKERHWEMIKRQKMHKGRHNVILG